MSVCVYVCIYIYIYNERYFCGCAHARVGTYMCMRARVTPCVLDVDMHAPVARLCMIL